ncbi:EutP/PduV family microcompartment system protein [Peribacillus asahii]|uniref:Ethanolamine utilization protein EutP n=1 Tax=Peribacillus asahii TaxID=228899 RepID=A0A3Q9RKF4_9BACI|nr:EutP/PduV family microcompartment system protein [Peribacillus asahii]AZV43784.1 ethanolamine utilization protein EutP [Peribacillus asahii]USK83526.1 50S ribosome-binding GTPase [Peribacillus asahii]
MYTGNRAMLIGSIGAGKSTLTNALLERQVKAVKTQALIYYDWIVDTPGEYTENPLFYKNIMATALEVTHVMYLQDATKKKNIFPPGFSMGINKLPIGVVTKSDSERADVTHAIAGLKQVIPKGPIVITSSVKGEGLQEIRNLVKCKSLQEMEEYIANHPSNHIIFK